MERRKNRQDPKPDQCKDQKGSMTELQKRVKWRRVGPFGKGYIRKKKRGCEEDERR